MNVSDLLRTKGAEVETIAPTATIADAARVLAVRRIGALVVSTDGGTIEGILSERDIVRLVADEGAGSLDEPVSRAMTAEVRTCARTDSVEDLMSVMTDHRIRHLPVSNGGRLDGIVSIGDVVKQRVQSLETERQQLTDYIQTGR
jgi:CBS domain-containing protein